MTGEAVQKKQTAAVEPVEIEKPRYKRVLIKLSGEALMGFNPLGWTPQSWRISPARSWKFISWALKLRSLSGEGNIIRGVKVSEAGFDRATGDYMGMLATVINSLALQSALEKEGIDTRVLSAIQMSEVAEPFIRRRAIRHLEKKRVVILAAGTGNPYFSTDTAAVLRAMEIKAEVILKATKVDGVYDSDPSENENAKLLKKLTYFQVLEKGLKVMDTTAISLCMDNGLPIIVFNLRQEGNIKEAVMGQSVGSVITG